AEQLVIQAKVLHRHTALGNAGGAAGLEHIYRLARQALRDPAPYRTAAQPLILKFGKSLQVLEAVDFPARIPTQARGELQPERAPGGRIEMPLDDLAHVGIELVFSLLNPCGQV